MAADDHATDTETDQKPTLRQRLHAATGDRDAEAEALADEAGDVSERDAKIAVQRARGERGVDVGEPEPAPDIATVADAEEVADERSP
jgi:hypothetical protein